MWVYLRTEFQVSSIIVTSFKQVGETLPPPPPQKKSLKSLSRLGLRSIYGSIVARDSITKLGEPEGSELQIDSSVWLSHTLRFIAFLL